MKLFVMMLILSAMTWEQGFASAANAQVSHVNTALDHLTVFEFTEPVTNVAAGSEAFHVEWKDNKVFVKPLRAKASTDLFIWTATHRYGYELETTGDAQGMTFAIDNPAASQTAAPVQPQVPVDELTDMVLTQAFLGMQKIEPADAKVLKEKIVVKIAAIYQTKSAAYIQYSVENRSGVPYRLLTPTVTLLQAPHPKISLTSLRHKQLSALSVSQLGITGSSILKVLHPGSSGLDLQPGHKIDGVVAVGQTLNPTAVIELSFGRTEKQPVQAAVVF